MLLTITTTHEPATDLGYLMHKHPDKFQSVKLSIGKAHIFYPEKTAEQTTIALLLDINPIDMVRGGRNLAGKGFSLGQYVNDRPYVASSFMSAAISKAFSTAMNGTCAKRPELVEMKIPLTAKISVLPAPKGGEFLIRKLFEPLGYTLKVERHVLDTVFPDWGESKYYTLELSQTTTIQALLTHLYVLIPVLDNDKHYFVSEAEIQKLLDKGEGWLAEHPEKEQITKRYLINLGSLSRKALQKLEMLKTENEATEIDENIPEVDKVKKESLHQKRLKLTVEQLKKSGAKSVLDLGCGEGKLIRLLLKDRQFEQITGTDVAYNELLKAKERLHWDDMSPKQQERLELFQGSLLYKDKRLEGFDAAAIVEVIEHLDESRLEAFERVVFEFAKPKTVILTTPNSEYNVLFESMSAGTMRHKDHRFEWTRAEFETWANRIAEKYGYKVEFLPIGEVDENVGSPSQMAIFNT
jgi:3' terminal RNA ribose 2'-O-methyltransferase Hen1